MKKIIIGEMYYYIYDPNLRIRAIRNIRGRFFEGIIISTGSKVKGCYINQEVFCNSLVFHLEHQFQELWK